MQGYVLAIDQGTTSSRAIVFDAHRKAVAISQKEFRQIFPRSGWVEHDAEEIWASVVDTCREAIASSNIPAKEIAAIGITNQRETTVIWDRETGRPVHNAIVWQDRRTAKMCDRLKSEGAEADFVYRTGLLLDPYFSGTKIAWLLDNVDGLRQRAADGKLAFGTIDSYLIWNLTGGARHVTDATNASRTLLFNIEEGDWDAELLRRLDIPRSLLPEVLDCSADFGVASADLLGAAIPVLGAAGDQQAATIGNACFQPGMLKSTYGTGCFALLNTGGERVHSKNRLLSTIGYRLKGNSTFALEGSIFMAGATVQWLRDALGFMKSASESDSLASRADTSQQVYLVPAFTGLGAPHWDTEARGALFGMTRNTGPAEITRAALEAVCYQTHDLLSAMRKDWKSSGDRETVLRVDGGMVSSDWTMQFLSSILDAPVDRPVMQETTALGAAWLAASEAGLWPGATEFAREWALDRRFEPDMQPDQREARLAGWSDAVRRTLTTPTNSLETE